MIKLFRNTGSVDRKNNWVKNFMTPYDYNYHYLKIHISKEKKSDQQIKEDCTLMRVIKALPCISIKTADDGSIKFTEMLTINHRGTFYLIFNFFVTFCCLFSSYMYMAIAAFRTDRDSITLGLAIMFEVIFCIDIAVSFLLSYERQDTQVETIEWNI